MKNHVVTALIAASLAMTSAIVPAQNSSPPLIERAKLFGNPSRSGASLAPDGKHLAWFSYQ